MVASTKSSKESARVSATSKDGRIAVAIEDKGKAQALQRTISQIEKSFGKGSIMRLDEEAHLAIPGISTGCLSLDLALGGKGIPRGRIIEVFGPESSGKTTVALTVAANAQKEGGVAAFIDAEHALDPSWAKKLGVDLETLLVSQPSSGEEAMHITEMLVKSNAVDVIIVDSVAALVPKAEIEGEIFGRADLRPRLRPNLRLEPDEAELFFFNIKGIARRQAGTTEKDAKIALFTQPATIAGRGITHVTHSAKRVVDQSLADEQLLLFESKLGSDLRVEHVLAQLSGTTYGAFDDCVYLK